MSRDPLEFLAIGAEGGPVALQDLVPEAPAWATDRVMAHTVHQLTLRDRLWFALALVLGFDLITDHTEYTEHKPGRLLGYVHVYTSTYPAWWPQWAMRSLSGQIVVGQADDAAP